MTIPPIDLSGVVKLLKQEGRAEILSTPKKFGQLLIHNDLIREWDRIVSILEKEFVPHLARGGEVSMLAAPARKLAHSVKSLSLMASEILSFVPGPIGMVCSLINAIVCFSTGNIGGGVLELLGCIPGGKLGVKAVSKCGPKIGKLVAEIVQNASLWRYADSGALKVLEPFVEKAGKGSLKSRKTVAGKLDIDEATYYMKSDYGVTDMGVRNTSIGNRSVFSPQIGHEARQSVERYSRVSPPSIGSKTILWPSR